MVFTAEPFTVTHSSDSSDHSQVQEWRRKFCHLSLLFLPQPHPQSYTEQCQNLSSGSGIKRKKSKKQERNAAVSSPQGGGHLQVMFPASRGRSPLVLFSQQEESQRRMLSTAESEGQPKASPSWMKGELTPQATECHQFLTSCLGDFF